MNHNQVLNAIKAVLLGLVANSAGQEEETVNLMAEAATDEVAILCIDNIEELARKS